VSFQTGETRLAAVSTLTGSSTPTLRTLLRYVSSEAWAFAPTAGNAGELRDMVSNPLDPDLMTASERLAEAASLLARGILRRRLRAADGRKKPLDVLREPRDE